MKTRAGVIGLAIALAGGSSAAPSNHARLSATAATIDDTSGSGVRLPYEIDPEYRIAKVDVIDVSLDGRRDADLMRGFPSARSVDDAVLELAVERSALTWPGAYQVVLRMTLAAAPPPGKPGSGAAAPAAAGWAANAGSGASAGAGSGAAPASAGSAAPGAAGSGSANAGSGSNAAAQRPPEPPVQERVTVTVTRTAPRLADPPAIAIKLTSGDWFFGSDQSVTPLMLQETTHRAAFSHLTVQQRGVTIHDSAPTDIKLDVRVAPIGPPFEPRITWTGDVPLGTSSGTLEINADQLDKPMTVAFTIDRRRWSGLIFFLFLGGGIVGYFVRTRAARVDERVKLGEDGKAVFASLDALIARSLARERDELIKARNAISDAVAARKPDVLRQAIEDGKKAAARASEVHRAQLEERTAILATVAKLPTWLLTREIGIDLGGFTDRIDAINSALIDHDVARTERGLRAIAERAEVRRDALAAWTHRLAAALARLGSTPAPRAIAERWKAPRIDAIRAAEGSETPVVKTLETVQPALKDLDAALFSSASELVGLAAMAKTKLTSVPHIARTLADASRPTDGDLPARADQLAAALATWHQTILGFLHPLTQSGNAAIKATAVAGEAALDAGDYPTALGAIAELGQAPQGGVAVDVPDVTGPERREQRPEDVVTVSDVGGPTDALFLPSGLRRESAFWRVVRVVFAYLVLPFGAWIGFHESFIGAPAELIALAATGFVTDFTADAAAIAKLQSLEK